MFKKLLLGILSLFMISLYGMEMPSDTKVKDPSYLDLLPPQLVIELAIKYIGATETPATAIDSIKAFLASQEKLELLNNEAFIEKLIKHFTLRFPTQSSDHITLGTLTLIGTPAALTLLKNLIASSNEARENAFECLMCLVSLDHSESYMSLITFLIQAGVRVNKRNAAPSNEVLALLVEAFCKEEPIASKPYELFVREMFSQKEPIIHAAKKGNSEIVRKLINAGAQVNAQDGMGKTVLMHAAQCNHVQTVEVLLNANADVNACDKEGKTPLMVTSSKEIAKALLDRGADVNAKDNQDQTALFYAITIKSKELVELFLAAGANPNTRSRSGDTPLNLAQRSAYNYHTCQYEEVMLEIQELLEKHNKLPDQCIVM
jgi:hypothetical protein